MSAQCLPRGAENVRPVEDSEADVDEQREDLRRDQEATRLVPLPNTFLVR